MRRRCVILDADATLQDPEIYCNAHTSDGWNVQIQRMMQTISCTKAVCTWNEEFVDNGMQ